MNRSEANLNSNRPKQMEIRKDGKSAVRIAVKEGDTSRV